VRMEAEERDGREDDGAEQDLGYVVVEDLVVGVREVIRSVFREYVFQIGRGEAGLGLD